MGKGLTDAFVAGLKPEAGRQTEHPDAKAAGLILRVSPGGTKTWVLRYAAPTGERRRMKLGTYPALSLAAARKAALENRLAVENERDPAKEKVDRRRSAVTLDDLAQEYWTAATKGLHGGRGRPKRASSIAVDRQRYEKHASPALGATAFAKITRGDVRSLERKLTEAELSPHTVAGVLNVVRGVLGMAVHEERLPANPALGVVRTASLEGRERRWTGEEARRLYAALEEPGPRSDPAVNALLRFLALTLTRRDEGRMATWREIDAGARVWTIPAERMKARRAHVVPLTSAALELLEAQRAQTRGEGLIFPRVFAPGEPMHRGAANYALAQTCVRAGVPHGSPHDWRRTAATLLTSEALGFRRFIVGHVLGHAADDGARVTGVYDRNDYLSDKRRALEAWAGFLTQAESSNVVPLRSGAHG